MSNNPVKTMTALNVEVLLKQLLSTSLHFRRQFFQGQKSPQSFQGMGWS